MSRRVLLGTSLIIVLGFWLRTLGLANVPFRGDEAFSAQYWAGIPLSQSLSTIATIEPHPPLTYALFRAWGLWVGGGDNEFTLRFLGVLCNLIGIPALYIIGKRLGNSRYGLLVALLWALHPFEIWHAQDFRNYAVWGGFSTLGLYWGLHALQTGKRKSLLAYAMISLITALIFYFELLSFATLGLIGCIVLFRNHRQRLIQWISLHAIVGAIVVGAFLFFQSGLFTSGSYGGNTEAFSPHLWLTLFLPTLLFGETLAQTPYGLPIAFISLSILGYCVWLLSRHHRNLTLFMLALGIIPILLLSLVALRVSIFTPRYVISAVPAFILLLGAPVIVLPKQRLSRVLAIFVGVAYGALLGQSLINHHTNPLYAKSPNWFAVRDYFQASVSANDVIVQTSVDAALGYYLQPIASKALPYNPTQPVTEIEGILEELVQTHDALWLFEHTRLDWQNANIAPDWIRNNLQAVRETRLLGQPVQQFLTWELTPEEQLFIKDDAPLAKFENSISLMGHQLYEELPTKSLTLVVYWQATARTEEPLKVFAHLTGAWNPSTQSPLWAQDDRYPQNGRIGSQTWEIGRVYRDVYHLNIGELPIGEYVLSIGFYNPNTNERVLTLEGTDAHVITTWQVNK